MKKYLTVCEKTSREFDDNVNKRLNEGYELYGNPFVTEEEVNGNKYQSYNQVMIKEKSED